MSTASESRWPRNRVVPFAELSDQARGRGRIDEICALCASEQSLATAASSAAFSELWLGYYAANHPDLLLVATDERREITAYLSGCLDSAAADPLFDRHVHYAVFEDLFKEFPAHFHINCHPAFQRRGYGRRLVERFLEICEDGNVPGVHVVTAPGVESMNFYLDSGLDETVERSQGGRAYLFMGRHLPRNR